MASSLTFGTGASMTCGMTRRPVFASPSRVAGLARGPGETRGSCRGDEAKGSPSESGSGSTPQGHEGVLLTHYSRPPPTTRTSLHLRETWNSGKAVVAGGAVIAAATWRETMGWTNETR